LQAEVVGLEIQDIGAAIGVADLAEVLGKRGSPFGFRVGVDERLVLIDLIRISDVLVLSRRFFSLVFRDFGLSMSAGQPCLCEEGSCHLLDQHDNSCISNEG